MVKIQVDFDEKGNMLGGKIEADSAREVYEALSYLAHEEYRPSPCTIDAGGNDDN